MTMDFYDVTINFQATSGQSEEMILHDIQLLKDDFNFNPKLVEDSLEKI